MSKFKGTPAPWRAIPNSSWGEDHKANFSDKSGFVICYGRENKCLASVVGLPFIADSKEVTEANAKLIADAPELLEAVDVLIGLLEAFLLDETLDESSRKIINDDLELARAAIKKATE